jgi:hypothetical protein
MAETWGRAIWVADLLPDVSGTGTVSRNRAAIFFYKATCTPAALSSRSASPWGLLGG